MNKQQYAEIEFEREARVRELQAELDQYKRQRCEDIATANKRTQEHDALQVAYAVAMKWLGELTARVPELEAKLASVERELEVTRLRARSAEKLAGLSVE